MPADRAAACYDAYYEAVYTGRAHGDGCTGLRCRRQCPGRYARENVSEKYADIDDIYNEANYNYANELYAQKKPYEALRYISQHP